MLKLDYNAFREILGQFTHFKLIFYQYYPLFVCSKQKRVTNNKKYTGKKAKWPVKVIQISAKCK